ncbi:site-specific DNA-methyltransferase [Pasteurella multocida]|uniref:site-specific DNA-methyltransferase n=1 Tax=Pasteurella multocida TaxID=747 RepID=UPI002A52CEBE|nr:site-specific DNA-methyltransferase [Pasteurella multocida]
MSKELKMHTNNLVAKNIEKLTALFPNCITETQNAEGKIIKGVDFDLLRQELSETIIEGDKERYRLDWVGKKEAILTANAPIAKTLRPCREESVNFDTTQNLFIEGDNLDALKLLQETYLGKVKMIYIDPPYNTGNDFIYNDDFAETVDDFLARSNQVDEEGNRLVTNTESNGRFHSDWLSMMYSRLKLARNLLTDDGVIFISIDDNEQANLKRICDEIFGNNNFIGCAGRITKKSNNKGDFWAPNFDYLMTYTKNIFCAIPFFGGANVAAYNLLETEGPRKGEYYQLVRLYMSTIQNRNPEQRYWIECPDGSKIIPPGNTFPPDRPELGDGIWRWTKKKFEEEKSKIVIKKVRSSNLINEDGLPSVWNVFTKTYLNDVIANSSAKPNSFIEDHINQKGSHEINALGIPFDYSKPTSLIEYLMQISKINDRDIILDFFAGSSTTAHAVMRLNAEDGGNRRFIMVQLPEKTEEKSEAYKAGYQTIAGISKERIRRAGNKILADYVGKEGIDQLDIGFRVLKIDSSNMKEVYYTPDNLSQTLLDHMESNIKEDRSAEDLLFQVMLDWGIELSLPIEQKSVGNSILYYVGGNSLVACFDTLTLDVINEIAKHQPLRVVSCESAIQYDQDKTNIKERFKQLSPETDVRFL